MLRYELLHPGLLAALAGAGHGSRVLIADGNYPTGTTAGPNASIVHLNLSPDLVKCTDVLAALATAVVLESASVMDYAREGPYALAADPPIWAEFEALLVDQPCEGRLDRVERFAFYDEAAKPDVAIVVATGDTRVYANLLLTIGVRKPGTPST